jgi:competence protein ComEA
MIRALLALCLLMSVAGTALATVDANTATVEQLQGITGIGPTIAQRIVDERRNGPYRSLEDLQSRVRGIGETSIRKMGAAGLTAGGGAVSGNRRPAPGARGEVIEVRPGGSRSLPGAPPAAGGSEPRSAGARP